MSVMASVGKIRVFGFRKEIRVYERYGFPKIRELRRKRKIIEIIWRVPSV